MRRETSLILSTLVIGATLLLPACKKAEAPAVAAPPMSPGCAAIAALLAEEAAVEARFEAKADELYESNPLALKEVCELALKEQQQLQDQLLAVRTDDPVLKSLLSDAADSGFISIKMIESVLKNFSDGHYESLQKQLELMQAHEKRDEAIDQRLKTHCGLSSASGSAAAAPHL